LPHQHRPKRPSRRLMRSWIERPKRSSTEHPMGFRRRKILWSRKLRISRLRCVCLGWRVLRTSCPSRNRRHHLKSHPKSRRLLLQLLLHPRHPAPQSLRRRVPTRGSRRRIRARRPVTLNAMHSPRLLGLGNPVCPLRTCPAYRRHSKLRQRLRTGPMPPCFKSQTPIL
jgi:hypothetical protein